MSALNLVLKSTIAQTGGTQLYQMESLSDARRITITVKSGDPLLALAVGAVTHLSAGTAAPIDYEP